MAAVSVLYGAYGSLPSPGVYQTGSSVEDAVFWMLLAIAIIAAVGIILYLLFFRGSYERERQAALALVGARRPGPAPRDDPYSRSASAYTYRGEVPDAVAAAMSGIRREPEPVLEVEAEREEAGLPAYLYTGGRQPQGPRRGAPLPPPRAYDGRVDRPPRQRGRPAAASPLDDLLGAGGGLRDEDRELLREEQLEPEPQAPGLYEDEEVTFEDEPEPAPAVHPPYRAAPAGKPVWESVLESPAGGGPAGEVELIDLEEPAPAGPALSKPVSDALLRDDILKSVRGPAASRPPAPPGRAVAGRGAAPGRPSGPAWSEGRPVFSKPLEEPDVPASREAPPAGPIEDTLGDISHKLRAMDGKAVPRLPPKAEAKMGIQERKFLEALRAVQEKKREEERVQEEEGRRMLESQMRELEQRKREDEERRRAEERRRQPARQDAVSRENERRRREAQSREQKAADVDDVLARIGIK